MIIERIPDTRLYAQQAREKIEKKESQIVINKEKNSDKHFFDSEDNETEQEFKEFKEEDDTATVPMQGEGAKSTASLNIVA